MSLNAAYSPTPHTAVHEANTKARNQIGLPSLLLSMMLRTVVLRDREEDERFSLLGYEYERRTVECHINGEDFGKSYGNEKPEWVCENRRAIAVYYWPTNKKLETVEKRTKKGKRIITNKKYINMGRG